MRTAFSSKRKKLNCINSINLTRCIIVVLAALFVSLYITFFLERITNSYTGFINSCLKAIPLSVLVGCSFSYVFFGNNRLLLVLFRYRYLIGFTAFVFCVVFEVSGSSIGVWASYLPNSNNDGLLWGEPLGIRSDEWAINIPFYFAQDQTGYHPVSNIIRGTETSVSLLPALASYSIVSIFRPFTWGYLLFGMAHGLAWSFALKNIALFLVTIEFFRIFTNNNKSLSVIAAVIVTFSPYSLWWNAGDVLLYGELLVVLLHAYLYTAGHLKKSLLILSILWMCGCYIFIVYPAWMVPCFYIFALIGIYLVVDYFKKKKEHPNAYRSGKIEICVVAVGLVVLIVAIGMVFKDAALAVTGMKNSIYPGSRMYSGGDGLSLIFDWLPSIFFPIGQSEEVYPNVCERSAYFSLFPVGSLFALYTVIKKRNKFLFVLLLLQVFFVVFLIVGIPDNIAKILMMTFSMSNRMLLPIGFLEIMLLIISLALLPPKNEIKSSISLSSISVLVIPIGLSFLVCVIANAIYPAFLTKKLLALLFVALYIIIVSMVLLVVFNKKLGEKCLLISFSAVLISSGICVNPLQRGVSELANNAVYEEIEHIADQDPNAIWIAEGSFVYSNLCVAAGARTITSTNTYPNIDLWNQMDPNGDYKEVYLRYTNIDASVSLNDDQDLFVLQGTDYMRINFTPPELEDIGVKYMLATTEHISNSQIGFNELAHYGDSNNNIYIYQLHYT